MYIVNGISAINKLSLIGYVKTEKTDYAVRLSRDGFFQIFDNGKKVFQIHVKNYEMNNLTLQKIVNYVFEKYHF